MSNSLSEILVQAFIDDRKEGVTDKCGLSIDQDLMFFRFPQWLASRFGIAIDPRDKQGMINAWADFGEQFEREFVNAEKEAVHG